MNTFSITHRLTLKEYRKLTFALSYRRPVFVIVNLMAALFLLYNLVLLFSKKIGVMDSDTYGYGIFITSMALVMVLLLFFTTARNFRTNYRLNENITYQFSDEGYTVTGESFNSNLDWNKVYKVRIMPGWLLIYHSRALANLIKIDPSDLEHIEELKHFLKASNFRAKLKW